jgi:hypothetical protein
MTKEGRVRMIRELNKQPYVFQLPGGEVIKYYYLMPML